VTPPCSSTVVVGVNAPSGEVVDIPDNSRWMLLLTMLALVAAAARSRRRI